ncbi:MAG: restriction endonuclease subunit S [Desulfoprunum sp.]|nr:restriction endonuclease subunit S [Desulfoprunum sp.]
MKRVAYPKYKESGVPWLGEVPEGWEIKAIKWESHVQRGASPRPIDNPVYFDDDGDYAWVRISDVTSAGMYLESTEQTLSDLGSSLSVKMQPGSLFLSIAGSVGKPCITKIKCCIHDGFVYFPRWKGDARFLYYIFASGEPYKGLGKMGTQLNLNTDTVGGIVLGLPNPTEQIAIADFLDRETGRIDTLVAKNRTLVDLLKEKRIALISRTVIRGLPAAAAHEFGLELHTHFKDSGVEWLGEVPEVWEVKQLKWSIMFQRGHDLPTEKREEGTIPLVTSAGISATHSVAAAKGPGIVTGRYGTIGEFYLVEQDYWPLNTTLYSITTWGNDLVYLCYMLSHLKPLFLLNAVKSAVPGIDRNDIHTTMTTVPPLPEQTTIATYLDLETAKLDKLVEKVEAAVARLQEYRMALITAAVTGKIDVRQEAA